MWGLFSRLAAAAAVATIFTLLAGAPAAAAVEETGKPCVANAAKPDWTLVGFDPGQIYPVPLFEQPNRVITRWKVEVAPGIGPLEQQLVAFQAVGEEEVRKIGEGTIETVASGSNEFATRIPFQGLHPLAGTHGPIETLYCNEEGVASGVLEGSFAMGETRHMKITVGVGTPVTLTIEPDRDGDGYGDLTQDGCPQLAAVHEACPFVRLRPHVTAVTKRAILLQVSTGDPTTVQVSGQVGWPRRQRGTGGRGAPHTGAPVETIAGLSGGSQPVGAEPGVLFTIPLPAAVRHKLARMTPKERLKGQLTVTATDVAGQLTTQELTVRLPGHKRAHRRR